MAEAKTKTPKVQGGGKKIKQSKANYNSEGRDKKNKVIRQARHKKLLARRAERKAANPNYVLPSKIKRFAKRHAPKPKKVVEVVKAEVNSTPEDVKV